jgi:hypothetical protein
LIGFGRADQRDDAKGHLRKQSYFAFQIRTYA